MKTISKIILAVGILATVFVKAKSASPSKIEERRGGDSTKFTALEPIYVLNGKVFGPGKANREEIARLYVKVAKKITLLTDATSILKYGGVPSKNIIVFYETYKSEQEKRDFLSKKAGKL